MVTFALASGLALTSPSALAAPMPVDDDALSPPPAPKPRARFGSRVAIDNAYSSNLFHVQQRRLDQFDSRGGSGERFDGMRGPWDLATRISVDGRLRYKLAKKRRFGTELEAAYVLHARNEAANYVELSLGLSHDLTRDDHLELDTALTPRRFKKNYRIDGAGGSGPFTAARYLEVHPELAYGHDWSKAWTTSIAYDVRLRRFESPHENHGESRHRVSLRSEHRLSRRVRLGFEAGPGIGLAPVQPEGGGYPVDRSYRTLEAGAGVALRPVKRFELGFDAGYRLKQYTTDVQADTLREGRTDHRVQLSLWLDKRFGKHVGVDGYVEWTRNLTNRSDPALEADAFDYEELVVGIGVNGRI